MKTLGAFLQRLEDDVGFENEARAFNQGDDLMAFVKSKGYDFSLDELTTAFKQRENLPPEAENLAPAPPILSASPPPAPEVTPFPAGPPALPHGETSAASPKHGERRFAPGAIEAGAPETTGGNFPGKPGGKVNGRLV